MNGCQMSPPVGKATYSNVTMATKPRRLRPDRREGGDGRRGHLDGCPGAHWWNGTAEILNTRLDQHEDDRQHGRRRDPIGPQTVADAGEDGRAGFAVQQRHAVEHHGRGEHPEEEVLGSASLLLLSRLRRALSM